MPQKRMNSSPDRRGGGRAATQNPSAFAERVLALVDKVPRGTVVTYGDVATMLGTRSPRSVGQVLARWGSEVSWWRVVRSDGRPPAEHAADALAQLARERVPLQPGGAAVDLSRARWRGSKKTEPLQRRRSTS
jgi:alkylated DNA nucleotide flippase Atl1